MNYVKFLALSVFFILALCLSAAAQNVLVTASAGTPAGSYPTLKDTFDNINNGTHQGVIGISIVIDTTETAPAVLNASGSGAALYTAINISAVGARSVTGTIAAGSPLIDLNGADNVTIDGAASGGSLIIANGTISATAGTSTIRFINDASNNTVTRSTVLGSSTMATTVGGGTIFFSTATTTGNDNNTISANDIGPVGINAPTKAISSNGTAATHNSGISITGNNIFDFFNPAATSNGVLAGTGSTDWIISNNRFYQTGTRTATTSSTNIPIQVNNVDTAGANNMQITGNIIGFASNTGTGVYTLAGTAKFIGISFAGGATTPSSIDGNLISGISINTTVAGTSTGGPFIGIFTTGNSRSTIGTNTPNTIGSYNGAGTITFSSSATTTSDIHGIFYFANFSTTISRNDVGAFTVGNTSTGAVTLWGIRVQILTTQTATVHRNRVGSTLAPMINNGTATASRVVGIGHDSFVPASTITENVVRSLTTAAPNVGTGVTASVIGIQLNAASANTLVNTISNNRVYSLSNTNTAAAVTVTGIAVVTPTTGPVNIVERNFVHSLSLSSTAAALMRGINIVNGLMDVRNNMVRLGVDGAGASVTGGYDINGITDTAGTTNYYFNSVYIGGTANVTTANTFAFNGLTLAGVRNVRNNIFANNRATGGGTGVNAAAFYTATLPSPTTLVTSNNLYYSQDPNTIVRNGTTNYSLAAWQAAAVNQDAGSIQASTLAQVGFANPNGTENTVDLHITAASLANDAGTPITSFAERTDAVLTQTSKTSRQTVEAVKVESANIAPVTNDFDNQTRSATTPDIGADEFAAFTAATVTISGRIQTPDGAGIRNVYVTLTEQNGETRSVATGSFGYYSFDEVQVGQTVVLRATAKRYSFSQPERVIFVEESIDNLNFVTDGAQTFRLK
jgi:trimeric autotransporter adhesin